MDCSNQFRKLTCSQFMVADVFADDLGREIRIVSVGVHGDIPWVILFPIYAKPNRPKGA